MKNWKQEFIQFCFTRKILKFGKFKLKSGETSSFFFNFSHFNKGYDLEKLGFFYAKKIIESQINYNALFGIAYKGIPIVITATIALKKYFNINTSYCFNRKEIKNYGEHGNFIGCNLKKKNILILDDVITSGISIKNAIDTIQFNEISNNNLISGILVALDRRKKQNSSSKILKKKHNVKIISIIKIYDIINYIKNKKILFNYLENVEKMILEVT
ncbi:MAG: orotate phosphoribosyltransferase [Buchnera aphidicola (Nurudea yanoniella)]